MTDTAYILGVGPSPLQIIIEDSSGVGCLALLAIVISQRPRFEKSCFLKFFLQRPSSAYARARLHFYNSLSPATNHYKFTRALIFQSGSYCIILEQGDLDPLMELHYNICSGKYLSCHTYVGDGNTGIFLPCPVNQEKVNPLQTKGLSTISILVASVSAKALNFEANVGSHKGPYKCVGRRMASQENGSMVSVIHTTFRA